MLPAQALQLLVAFMPRPLQCRQQKREDGGAWFGEHHGWIHDYVQTLNTAAASQLLDADSRGIDPGKKGKQQGPPHAATGGFIAQFGTDGPLPLTAAPCITVTARYCIAAMVHSIFVVTDSLVAVPVTTAQPHPLSMQARIELSSLHSRAATWKQHVSKAAGRGRPHRSSEC